MDKQQHHTPFEFYISITLIEHSIIFMQASQAHTHVTINEDNLH